MAMSADNYRDTYTDPELRERLKEEIKAGSQGGREGQWSARKSQMLTLAYEREGGGYRAERNESQRSLQDWTKEDWKTADTPANAPERSLPKAQKEAGAEQATRLPQILARYDDLTVAELDDRAAGLDAEELRQLLEHERARKDRKGARQKLERRIDGARQG